MTLAWAATNPMHGAQAKKCGVRAYGWSRPLLRQCVISDCGTNGLVAGGNAFAALEHCTVKGCAEDGVVGMQVGRSAVA